MIVIEYYFAQSQQHDLFLYSVDLNYQKEKKQVMTSGSL